MMRLSALSLLLSSVALAQGGHFGEGAGGSLLHMLLGLILGLGLLVAVALLLVRPQRDPPVSLTGPTMLGAALCIPIVILAVVALFWLESLIAGALIALGLSAAYVAVIARRWRR